MSAESSKGETPAQSSKGGNAGSRPDWADGLRQLYDSVVDEPLPDSFKDLLDKLDDAGGESDDSSSGSTA